MKYNFLIKRQILMTTPLENNRSEDSLSAPLPRDRIYKFIPFQIRQQLIQLVFEEGMPILLAAKQLDVNYSTAKAITKQYEKRGHIFRRKAEMGDSPVHRPKPRPSRKQHSQPHPRPEQPPKTEQEAQVVEAQGACNIPPMPCLYYQPLYFYQLPNFPLPTWQTE